jgi:hypothetical protein
MFNEDGILRPKWTNLPKLCYAMFKEEIFFTPYIDNLSKLCFAKFNEEGILRLYWKLYQNLVVPGLRRSVLYSTSYIDIKAMICQV